MRSIPTLLLLLVVACSNDSAVDKAKTAEPTTVTEKGAEDRVAPQPLITNFDTPQAVYDAMKRAREEDDTERILSLMTEEGWEASIPTAIHGIALVAKNLGEGGEALKTLDALVKSHGLTGIDSIRLAGGENFGDYVQLQVPKIADKRAFLLEFSKWLVANIGRKKKKKSEAVLEELVITNDTATGSSVTHLPDRGTLSSAITFQRVDGQWKISSKLGN